MENQLLLTALRKAELFSTLSDEAFNELISLAKFQNFSKGDYIVREGTSAQQLFIVLEGEIIISKKVEESGKDYDIKKLSIGKSIGEVAILNNTNRIASAKANKDSKLAFFSIEEIDNLIYRDQKKTLFSPLLYKLIGISARRLNFMNSKTVSSLETEVKLLNEKNQISDFMINTITILCLFTFSAQWLADVFKRGYSSTYITFPLTVMFALPLLVMIKRLKLPLDTLGVNLNNWKKSLFESVIFSIPILLLMTLSKYFLVKYIPDLQHFKIFEFIYPRRPGAAIFSENVVDFILFSFVYIFLIVPIQEFIARGIIQGSLEKFTTSKNKIWHAIIVSNIIFSTLHLFMSVSVAILTFFPGVYLGWLYSRNRTLIGPWVAHALIGFWIIDILRFDLFVSFLY